MKITEIPNEILADLRLQLGIDDDDTSKDQIIQCYNKQQILTNWMSKNGLDISLADKLLTLQNKIQEFEDFVDKNGLFGFDYEIWLIINKCRDF